MERFLLFSFPATIALSPSRSAAQTALIIPPPPRNVSITPPNLHLPRMVQSNEPLPRVEWGITFISLVHFHSPRLFEQRIVSAENSLELENHSSLPRPQHKIRDNKFVVVFESSPHTLSSSAPFCSAGWRWSSSSSSTVVNRGRER